MSTRGLTLLPFLAVFLVACSSISQSDTPALASFTQVLVEIDRSYVDRPEFALIATGAAQALQDLAPQAAFGLVESPEETIVTYGEAYTITFRPQIPRDEVIADVTTLFRFARETTPAVPEHELARKMTEQALKRLDPESSFLDPEAFREFNRETAGTFAAIGLELTNREGPLTVVSPIETSPAHRAGIQAGDQIIEINGLTTKDLSLLEAVKRLRGMPGTKVRLTIEREGWADSRQIEIGREQMRLSAAFGRDLGEGIVYIRIRHLGGEAASDLDRTLKPFRSSGMSALILDLRNTRWDDCRPPSR